MTGSIVLLHIGIALVGVIALIVWLKIEPIIALVIAALYIGIASGVGLNESVAAVNSGFAELMGEIGLLITFGVLLGVLLQALGAAERTVELIARKVAPKRLPYVTAIVLTLGFPAIFAEVLAVIAAPVTKTAARRIGPTGNAQMSGAAISGIIIGTMFVVPGAGVIALAGLVDVPLSQMILYGIPTGLLTVLITTLIFVRLSKTRCWNPETDEQPEVRIAAEGAENPSIPDKDVDSIQSRPAGRNLGAATAPAVKQAPLALCVLPLAVVLIPIMAHAGLKVVGVENPFLTFIGNPFISLFAGLLLTYAIAARYLDLPTTQKALKTGVQQCGSILILTGVSGGLGAIVKVTGISDYLAGLFSSGMLSPLLLVWIIAAVLHAAVGSVTVGAFTAVGVIAPVMPLIDVNPVLIALAAGSGAMGAGMVTANAFWLFQTVFGLKTRGTFKIYTVGMTIASMVSLAILMAINLVV
ncbi:GntP family permease [Mycolicibacterium sp.]|uniref:GntP family permease n=1 Tax=Mycolicibacterium sp. TaxID=2320850 RepID=UPI0037C5C954